MEGGLRGWRIRDIHNIILIHVVIPWFVRTYDVIMM